MFDKKKIKKENFKKNFILLQMFNLNKKLFLIEYIYDFLSVRI
jgi:hypothetical protein